MSQDHEPCIADRIGYYAAEGLNKIFPEGHPHREDIQKVYKDIYQQIRGELWFNGNPKSVAAALIYMACVVCYTIHTQMMIADAFDVGVPTLRRQYRIIVNKEKEGKIKINYSS